jgi:hypothetical protein
MVIEGLGRVIEWVSRETSRFVHTQEGKCFKGTDEGVNEAGLQQ